MTVFIFLRVLETHIEGMNQDWQLIVYLKRIGIKKEGLVR